MNILGISAFYHDSAACLVGDGEIISAVQEERFTRKKHDFSFPKNAINSCLKEGRFKTEDIDLVVFYDKPFIKFERILETYLAYAPLGINSFIKSIPLWIKQKLWMKELIRKELGFKGKIIFPEHHESHAASCFFPSPFQEAAFLTIDGVGEWTTASYGVGKDNKIRIIAEIHFPHSLGLLYSAFTYYTGFKVNSGEYKVMGLWRTKWVLLSNAIYFLIISAVLIFLGVTAPILLKPIHKAWMALSIVIGFFVSRIILSVLFYLVVTPIGLLARLLGKDLLNRNFDRNEATYWMPKKTVQFNKNRYENQF